MEICENRIDPYNTEYAGTHDHDNRRHKALADTTAGGNGTIHKGADRIGETHNLRTLEPCRNDRFIIGKQG